MLKQWFKTWQLAAPKLLFHWISHKTSTPGPISPLSKWTERLWPFDLVERNKTSNLDTPKTTGRQLTRMHREKPINLVGDFKQSYVGSWLYVDLELTAYSQEFPRRWQQQSTKRRKWDKGRQGRLQATQQRNRWTGFTSPVLIPTCKEAPASP